MSCEYYCYYCNYSWNDYKYFVMVIIANLIFATAQECAAPVQHGAVCTVSLRVTCVSKATLYVSNSR